MYAKSAETQKCCAFRQSQQLFAAANAVCYFHQRCKKSLILNALAIAENKIMYALILIMLFVAASTDSTSASVKQRLFFITVELSGALPFTNADAAHIISDDILLTAKMQRRFLCCCSALCPRRLSKRYSAAEIKTHYPRCC